MSKALKPVGFHWQKAMKLHGQGEDLLEQILEEYINEGQAIHNQARDHRPENWKVWFKEEIQQDAGYGLTTAEYLRAVAANQGLARQYLKEKRKQARLPGDSRLLPSLGIEPLAKYIRQQKSPGKQQKEMAMTESRFNKKIERTTKLGREFSAAVRELQEISEDHDFNSDPALVGEYYAMLDAVRGSIEGQFTTGDRKTRRLKAIK